MPNVTVSPIKTISVKVGTDTPRIVNGTTTFVGGTADFTNQIKEAKDLAQDAYNAANTKLSMSGGTITGDLTVTGNTTSSVFFGTLDGGTFT